MTVLSTADEGKHLMDVEGERIGIVSEVDAEAQVACVDPEPGISQALLQSFGFGDAGEDDIEVHADSVETVTDTELRAATASFSIPARPQPSMSTETDLSQNEMRMYDGDERKATLYVTSGVGCVAVDVVDERVGGFELVTRGAARDVTADDGVVALATDGDVLVGHVGASEEDTHVDEFAGTGHGEAVAVSVVDGGAVLAAGTDGDVSRLDPAGDGGWTDRGTVAGEVRAMDGTLCAAGDGVYRFGADPIHAGLDDARDVSAAGSPRAATGDGLYRLGNGWLDGTPGDATLVASDGGGTATDGDSRPERAHAVVDGELLALSEGEWVVHPDQPEGTLVGIAYDRTTYLVTAAGRVLAAAEDGWRGQSVGVPDVSGVAVVGPD